MKRATTNRLARLVELLLAVAVVATVACGDPFSSPWGFALGY